MHQVLRIDSLAETVLEPFDLFISERARTALDGSIGAELLELFFGMANTRERPQSIPIRRFILPDISSYFFLCPCRDWLERRQLGYPRINQRRRLTYHRC
jgi:hypothetical protein